MAYTADAQRWRGPENYEPYRPPYMHHTPWHPGWIVLTILGFIFWWPVGLALLFFTIGSRKMGCWSQDRFEYKMQKMQNKMDRVRSRMEGFGFRGFNPPTSGNRAFDEYRQETLRRLADEQREFVEFLDRLRFAKDRAEFDQFMAERRSRPQQGPEPQPQG